MSKDLSLLPMLMPLLVQGDITQFKTLYRTGDLAVVGNVNLFNQIPTQAPLSPANAALGFEAWLSTPPSGVPYAMNTTNGLPVNHADGFAGVYDCEHWTNTPTNEQNNLLATVQTAKSNCTSLGLKFMLAPDDSFNDLYTTSGLNSLAPYADYYIIQGQHKLAASSGGSLAKYISYNQTQYSAIKAANPNCVVVAQAVVGGTLALTVAQVRQAYEALAAQSILDVFTVFSFDQPSRTLLLADIRGIDPGYATQPWHPVYPDWERSRRIWAGYVVTPSVFVQGQATTPLWPRQVEPVRDLVRAQYVIPAWADPTLGAPETVLTDKWVPETQRPPKDLVRRQFTYPAYVDPTAGTPEIVFADRWHPEIQRPPKDLLRWQWLDPYTFYADVLAGPNYPEEIWTDRWHPEIQRPPKDRLRWQWLDPWYVDPGLPRREVVFSDKWQPEIQRPPKDLRRFQWLWPSYFEPTLGVPEVIYLDRWIQPIQVPYWSFRVIPGIESVAPIDRPSIVFYDLPPENGLSTVIHQRLTDLPGWLLLTAVPPPTPPPPPPPPPFSSGAYRHAATRVTLKGRVTGPGRNVRDFYFSYLFPNAVGATVDVALVEGLNAVPVPVGAKVVLIQPPLGNLAPIYLLGFDNDAGVRLHLLYPSLLSLTDATGALFFKAGAGVVGTLECSFV